VDVDGYRLYYGRLPQVYTDTIEVGGSSHMVTVSDLIRGRSYFFQVKAFNRNCETPFSGELEYMVPVK